MAVSGRWQLHPLHLYLVRRYLGIEDLTAPLDSPGYGATENQVGELGRREAPTMESLGILVNDEIDSKLANALRVLAKPYLWADSMWFPDFGKEIWWSTVAVLTEGNRVVLGVQAPGEKEGQGGLLTVEVHENVPLSQVILPTLPPAPPGNRGAVRVPASSFKQDAQEPEQQGFMQQTGTVRGNIGDRQLATYKAIGAAQHVRGGQIAANLRDRNGKVKRSTVLRWFDNAEPDGRYLDHNERGNTGEQMYMLTPADAGLIRTKVDELIKSVRS